MNLETCHCRNRRCKYCGKIKQESVLRPYGSRRGEERFVCACCGRHVEAREGTGACPTGGFARERCPPQRKNGLGIMKRRTHGQRRDADLYPNV